MLFKDFGGVDAFPLCLATKDVETIVATVLAIAPGFGGINLEDIAAPRCFEIEQRLRDELDIPVFHDDQHGTAIVVLAALVNALRVVGKGLEDVRIVTTGCGRRRHGSDEDPAGCRGAAHHRVRRGRRALFRATRTIAGEAGVRRADESRRRVGNRRRDARGADVFIGVSVPGAVTRAGIARHGAGRRSCSHSQTHEPEIDPEEIEDLAAVIATGRSDYPNQINNVLVFPGVFRGALDVRAQRDHQGDGARCRPRARRSHPVRPAFRGLHRPQRLRPERRATRWRAQWPRLRSRQGVARIGTHATR